MLKLRACNLGDCLYVAALLPEEERKQIEAFTGGFDIDATAMSAWRFAGPKWTLVNDEKPFEALVVGGYAPCRSGVYSSWFMGTAAAWRYGAEVTEHTHERIQWMLKNGAHRLETVCLASREQTRRWYEKIGLTYETTLKSYGVNGEDAVCYIALAAPKVVH